MFSARASRVVGQRTLVPLLQLLLAAAAGLAAAAAFAAAFAIGPAIDFLVVKYRDGIVVDQSAGLPAAEQAVLATALQTPYSHVGYMPTGALKLQMASPLALEAARAAVNRVRMLPQVLYANIIPPPSAVTTSAAAPASAPQQRPVRRLIVKFRDATVTAAANQNSAVPPAQLNRLSSLAGQAVAHERAMSGGAFVVRLSQSLPEDQARALASRLAADPSVEYAEPDLVMQPLALVVPNDPSFPIQWHYLSPPAEMGGVNLPPAWDLTTGSASVFVSVIDTGILFAHPDLADRAVGGYDLVSDADTGNDGDGRDDDPSDPGDWVTDAERGSGPYAGCSVRNSSFHGSHVAGTIGALTGNALGVAGINWVSRIVPTRVLGKCGGNISDIIDGIRWAAGAPVPNVPNNPNPARVLNMSLGAYGPCSVSMQSAIDVAIGAGAVVVVSAGNSAADASMYTPAGCDGVISVAATGRAGELAYYSNSGASVSISAPGGSDSESVLSTINDSATSPDLGNYTYGYKQGTSMATPHVSGIASLMLSKNPSLTPAQVLSRIQSTARAFPVGTIRDCTTLKCGSGIIDAAAAVAAAGPASGTALASSANPAVVGTTVTFTATVTGAAPTGTVAFRNGDATMIGCEAVQLAGTGSSTTAVCSISILAAGTYSIVAVYSGDSNNPTSTSAVLSQVISSGSTSNALTSGVPVVGLSGASGAELRYTLAVPAGATSLQFTIAGGTGDADLYVRFGSAPTTSAYNCSPYLDGNNESCTIAVAQAGTYHVMVRGYVSFSGVTLTANYTPPAANVPPTPNFTFTTSGLTANFTDTSTDSDGTIASRSWTFGDGGTSTLMNPSRTYAAASTYDVTLTVTDNAGATSNVTKSVTVTTPPPNVPPTPNFTFTTSGLTANFTDTSTDSDGTIASRSWTFGDGGTSTLMNPSRTYAAANTYDVTLTVTDNAGATSNVTKSVTVSSPPPPSNTLANGVPVTGLSGSTGTELQYTMAVPAGATNLRFTISGGSGDADLYVRFGAAPTTSSYNCRPYVSGNAETCTFATTQSGTYYVKVRGYSSFSGVTLSGSYGTGSANVPPTANFSFTTSGLTANFTDASSDSDGTIASRSWAFGDSATSAAINPSRTYAAAGTYTVTLTVTDNAGAASNVSKSVIVSAAPVPPPLSELTNGVPVTGLSGSPGTTLRYTLVVPAGATNLRFTISGGSGDADLYVRYGVAPTTSSYDCRPYLSGNSETCTFTSPQAGTYHVMVRAYLAFSGVTLTGAH